MSEQSSCWKCGRELPDGQIECPHGCNQPLEARDPVLVFQIVVHYDKRKLKTDAERMAWQKSVMDFSRMLGEIFIQSGINQFCKKP